MDIRKYFLLLFVSFVLAACTTTSPPPVAHKSKPRAKTWADTYPDCAPGGLQAPIDIPNQVWRDDEAMPLSVDFSQVANQIFNDGYTFRILFSNPKNLLYIGTDSYDLKEIIMHVPAETYITGQKYPMEWQFLYKNNEGERVILSSLVKYGTQNSELAALIPNLPRSYKRRSLANIHFTGKNLLPKTLHYYTFMGSLSTPPCTPDVRWYVMKRPITASIAQVNAFRKYFRKNARALQPLNERKVLTDG